jgi:hypothetical protein
MNLNLRKKLDLRNIVLEKKMRVLIAPSSRLLKREKNVSVIKLPEYFRTLKSWK